MENFFSSIHHYPKVAIICFVFITIWLIVIGITLGDIFNKKKS
jgi:hypothetical protein